MVKIKSKRAVKQRFYRAMTGLQQRLGWSAKQMASHYGLPHRSVLNWLTGKVCPGSQRLRELCETFKWQYEVMFGSEALRDETFETQHMSFRTLSQQYLRVQVRDPLDAWGFIPVAGAIAFVKLAAAGFECRAIIDHCFGVRIEFLLPALAKVSLEVAVVFGRGLIIRWLDEQGLTRQTMDLSDSNLQLIAKSLHSMAGR